VVEFLAGTAGCGSSGEGEGADGRGSDEADLSASQHSFTDVWLYNRCLRSDGVYGRDNEEDFNGRRDPTHPLCHAVSQARRTATRYRSNMAMTKTPMHTPTVAPAEDGTHDANHSTDVSAHDDR